MAGVAELDGLPPKTAIARHRFPTLAGVADYTPLAAKTRHLPPSPARDLAEWRVLSGNGGLHAIARQNMHIAAIVRPCPPTHTNNRRFHVLVSVMSLLVFSFHLLTLKALSHKWVALDPVIIRPCINNVDVRQPILLDISYGVHVSLIVQIK